MKVTEHIKKAQGKTQFTFEILPPVKGHNVQSIFDNIDPLMEFNPPFIDVTYHREEHVYNDLGNGLLQKKVVRKRPGTVGICAALQNKYNVDAVPHILCGGFSKEVTENLLIDLDFLGINNIVALRGDAIKSETYFTPNKEGHSYASELVNQISDLNKGKYLEEVEVSSKTDFCIGVAGYPEKHMEAPSLESDIHFLKEKIKLGAAYIVTQMFFDNKKFFEFQNICKKEGIKVPHRFHCDLPETLIKEVIKCKDNSQVNEVGIEWCIQQSKELKEYGVPFLHYYSMGKALNIKKIAQSVF
jgi:methylenetetrahydrofolate reductase (NADPH)